MSQDKGGTTHASLSPKQVNNILVQVNVLYPSVGIIFLSKTSHVKEKKIISIHYGHTPLFPFFLIFILNNGKTGEMAFHCEINRY